MSRNSQGSMSPKLSAPTHATGRDYRVGETTQRGNSGDWRWPGCRGFQLHRIWVAKGSKQRRALSSRLRPVPVVARERAQRAQHSKTVSSASTTSSSWAQPVPTCHCVCGGQWRRDGGGTDCRISSRDRSESAAAPSAASAIPPFASRKALNDGSLRGCNTFRRYCHCLALYDGFVMRR